MELYLKGFSFPAESQLGTLFGRNPPDKSYFKKISNIRNLNISLRARDFALDFVEITSLRKQGHLHSLLSFAMNISKLSEQLYMCTTCTYSYKAATK